MARVYPERDEDNCHLAALPPVIDDSDNEAADHSDANVDERAQDNPPFIVLPPCTKEHHKLYIVDPLVLSVLHHISLSHITHLYLRSTTPTILKNIQPIKVCCLIRV